MAIGDYDKTKSLVVESVSGTPTVDKAQPIYLTSGDDSQTGNGEIVLDWSGISGPEDIAVFDQNDNLLDYEIEELDTTNETGVIWVYNSWVRDGTVQAKIAYGNGPGDNQNVSAVWSNDSATFDGVYHLNGDAVDSTQKNNDGTINGATVASGEFADGYDFDGQDDWIDTNVTHGNESYFFMGWGHIDTTSTGNNQVDFISSDDSNVGMRLEHDDGEGLEFQVRGDELLGPITLNAGENYLIAGVVDNGLSTVKLYVDGVEEGSGTGDLGAANVTIKIGDFGNTSKYPNHWDGLIDEVKIGPSVISQDYIQAEFDASAKAGQVFSRRNQRREAVACRPAPLKPIRVNVRPGPTALSRPDNKPLRHTTEVMTNGGTRIS